MELSSKFSVIGIMMTVTVHTTISMTTASTESIDETDGCPNTIWTAHRQSCYLLMTDALNFTQANESCQELGAPLVFIGSEDENKYMQVLAGNLLIWIGLSRPTSEYCAGSSCRNWMWLDGSVPQYSHWAVGVSETSNQCAFMDSQGDWDHGRKCSETRAYICEQQRILPSTTQEPSTMGTSDKIDPTSFAAERNFVSTTDASGGNDGDGNTPLIVGCVVGVLLLVGIIAAVIVLAKRHRKNKIAQPNGSSQPPHLLSYRNTSKPDQPIREKDSTSPKRDKPSKQKDRKPSQRDKPKKHKDRKSTPKNQSVNYAIDDERPDGANGTMNRGYSYADVELVRKNKGLQKTSANSATGAHGGESNPEYIYAETLKKKNRPVSEGVEVQENPMYSSGK